MERDGLGGMFVFLSQEQKISMGKQYSSEWRGHSRNVSMASVVGRESQGEIGKGVGNEGAEKARTNDAVS